MTTHMLELTDDELFSLWFRLVMLENVGRLHGEEKAVLEKASKLIGERLGKPIN